MTIYLRINLFQKMPYCQAIHVGRPRSVFLFIIKKQGISNNTQSVRRTTFVGFRKTAYICTKIGVMIHIGNGKANFSDIIEDETHYVDRTDYIERLENSKESYVIFLRPRRFGKSLWLSILQYYYGVQYKDQFSKMFGNYYIGQNPTASANTYLILTFDFSGIESEDKDTVYRGFLENTRGSVSSFMSDYKTIFDKKDRDIVFGIQQPHIIIYRLFEVLKDKAPDKKIYLLIDEYDHFANQLMAAQFNDFKEIVSKDGFVRAFYETIKRAAGAQGVIKRILSRVFPLLR